MMDEESLNDAWAAIGPSPDERRRIDRRMTAWLQAADTSLAAEWLGLFQAAPFAAFGLATASAAAMAISTPLLWIARSLM
jgi:hypothetical protein